MTEILAHIRLTSMRAAPIALSLCLLALTALASKSHAIEVSGPAIVIDGDTLWVGGTEVRIHGIDAPETAQKCQLPKKGT